MAYCHTLSYSEDVKGWPSFYSFCAEYMVGMNGFFYTWSEGQLFKTMSYESDDMWECTSLFSDLSTGSMLQTWFVQKEGEWFTFLRENATTENFRSRSSNGIGTIWGVFGPAAAVVTTFQLDTIGNIISVGDNAYQVVPVAPPGLSGAPTLIGPIVAINRDRIIDPVTGVVTLPSITVDTTATGVWPNFNEFCLILKDAVSESHGARGYFLNFTLSNDSTESVELFSVGSSVMKSYP